MQVKLDCAYLQIQKHDFPSPGLLGLLCNYQVLQIRSKAKMIKYDSCCDVKEIV